ncbi:MBL fold metallo-hydrolase [Chroococcidiopsis sp. CCMEE 29]|uniref:MBL fold metallo-hydrolase n=1 Tax=Chroococcidiopsis sp. CCMEE 29 TaxID=155894 RepID=UPI00201FF023|nr:MBL fold metallo-hydrolase [Chroococcidiopsis sp. CCMEE 29]
MFSHPLPNQSNRSPKLPQAIWDNIFAFPPNRDTLGGTAYFIVENEANILIDCPAWDDTNQKFLHHLGGIRWLFLTHRGAIGKTREIQEAFGCEVLVQEQEAYLLPGLRVIKFQQEFTLSNLAQAIWTPGHSPGSSCLYYADEGGVLFSGRHLLPNQQGEPVPLRTAKTFHWSRQLKSIQLLIDRFTPETLHYLCPGANTGFLRGKRVVDRAYDQLTSLDLAALLQAKVLF